LCDVDDQAARVAARRCFYEATALRTRTKSVPAASTTACRHLRTAVAHEQTSDHEDRSAMTAAPSERAVTTSASTDLPATNEDRV
jgi:hypothetical protein